METRLPGLVAIEAQNPGPLTGAGNHTWLLTGAVPTLIDAGVGVVSHVEAVAAALESRGQGLRQVLVTHGHSDHISGTPSLHARWPDAALMKWPAPAGDPKSALPWNWLTDGQRIPAGDVTLEVIATPGHAPDHVCLWHRDSRTLFGGDLLIEGSTVVVPGRRGGDLIAYLDSLRRVAALAPLLVLPAHGPPIEDPLGLIERYIAHRAAREREVLDAVDGGAGDVESIVSTVYPSLDGPLRMVAVETAHAHVNKLIAEGRIRNVDGRLRPSP